MFSCKQVSTALTEGDYEKLSPMRKFFLKLHVKLCLFCGKFNRQVMDSQDMCRCYHKNESEGNIPSDRETMSDAKKDKLRNLLAAHSQHRID